jgi:hypothetical protein
LASSSLSLCGYSDADYAGCRVERKSTSGTCQFLRSSLVHWSSHKQSSITQSITKAEYVAVAACCSQLLWMIATLRDFGLEFRRVPLFCDSTRAISVAKNPVLHSKTKHIEVRFHFLPNHYEKGDIDLHHIDTQTQLIDIFTKPLDQAQFARLRGELEFVSLFRGGKFWLLYSSFAFLCSLAFCFVFCIILHFAFHFIMYCSAF